MGLVRVLELERGLSAVAEISLLASTAQLVLGIAQVSPLLPSVYHSFTEFHPFDGYRWRTKITKVLSLVHSCNSVTLVVKGWVRQWLGEESSRSTAHRGAARDELISVTLGHVNFVTSPL